MSGVFQITATDPAALLTLRREKHLSQANRPTDHYGTMWLFRPGRVRKFSVRSAPRCCYCSISTIFSIHDHLLTRLSNDDDMEKNLSTFANEMASCAMILGLASSRSLVLIDELGRATSPKEGVGISHAIAEELIKLKVWFLYDVIYITDTSSVLHFLCYVRSRFRLVLAHVHAVSQPLPRTFRYIIPSADCRPVDASTPNFM